MCRVGEAAHAEILQPHAHGRCDEAHWHWEAPIVGLANLFGDAVLSEELRELVDRKSGWPPARLPKACRMVVDESESPLGSSRIL